MFVRSTLSLGALLVGSLLPSAELKSGPRWSKPLPVPSIQEPDGYREAGNQCSTPTPAPLTVHRSIQSSVYNLAG